MTGGVTSAGEMTGGETFSLRRVGAMTLRYSYLLRSSYPRMLEMIYWPLVQMLTWGFLQAYLVAGPAASRRMRRDRRGLADRRRAPMGHSAARTAGLLLLLPRGAVGAQHPQSVHEPAAADGIHRLDDGDEPDAARHRHGSGDAAGDRLFGFNLWALGLAFAAFFAILILFAWSVGLFVAGLLLRYGLGAENLVWSLMFVIQPLGCVYYPVAVLPGWLQPICWALPPTYVFEGLRGVLIDHVLRADLMATGLAIDAAFRGSRLRLRALAAAREAGSLLQTGE